MDIKKNDTRLIGNFIEINADILSNQINSKLPSFIANMQTKYYRRKLLKLVDKLSKSDIILTRDNIMELIIYIHNHYEGNYDVIKNVVITTTPIDTDIYADVVIGENTYTITINSNSTKMEVRCNINYKKSSSGFNIYLDKLYSNRKECKEYIAQLNIALRTLLFKYIKDTISPYTKKGSKGYVIKRRD